MIRLFKPGDRVTLKSGRPLMEVIRYVEEKGLLGKYVSDCKVECVWYDPQLGRGKGIFHQNLLVAASRNLRSIKQTGNPANFCSIGCRIRSTV